MTTQTSRFAPHPAVTVHAAGTVEARKPGNPRNLLERAAECGDRDLAVSAVASALGITDMSTALRLLPDPYRWSRVSEATRLMELGEWLKAECFELLDLVDVGPISTIGD